MEKKYMVFILIIASVAGIGYLIYAQSQGPGKYDDLAMCLGEKGVKFYGSYQCSHCQAQKNDFGKSYKVLAEEGVYIECGPLGAFTNQECKDEDIRAVPLWKFSDGSTLSGRQPLENLALKSGCEIE